MNYVICEQAVVRPNGGYAVVLNWTMFTVYGVNKHEVLVKLLCFLTTSLNFSYICSLLSFLNILNICIL